MEEEKEEEEKVEGEYEEEDEDATGGLSSSSVLHQRLEPRTTSLSRPPPASHLFSLPPSLNPSHPPTSSPQAAPSPTTSSSSTDLTARRCAEAAMPRRSPAVRPLHQSHRSDATR